MGAVNVGSASVTIMPTMNGFAGKLNKQLGSAGTSGGAAFSKAFGGKAGGAAGGIVSKFKSAGTSAGAQMGAAAGAALSAKGAAIAGIAGGIVSAAAQKITAALSSLTGEITNASDSAQKFASTLGFGGVDTSTIDALTASTQDYATRPFTTWATSATRPRSWPPTACPTTRSCRRPRATSTPWPAATRRPSRASAWS